MVGGHIDGLSQIEGGGGTNAVLLGELAERLSALEEENGRLSAELQAQQHRVAALEGRPHVPVGTETSGCDVDVVEAELSRRGLLRKLGVLSAGTVVGTSLLTANPAAAQTAGDYLRIGRINDAGISGTTLFGSTAEDLLKIYNYDGRAIYGLSEGLASDQAAITGRSYGRGAGVEGAAMGQGVGLESFGGRAQLLLHPGSSTGAPTSGSHIKGEVFVDSACVHHVCVVGGTPGTWRADVVRGISNDSGSATTSLSSTATSAGGTLTAYNRAATAEDTASALFGSVTQGGNSSAGVWGTTSGSGAGVRGRAAGQGVGLQADGGRAQLLLVPAGSAGPPTTGAHVIGEVFVDSSGVQYFCVGSGTPGGWRKVAAGALGHSSRSGSLNFLSSPIRLYDSRSGPPLANGASIDLWVGGAIDRVRGMVIPSGAVGVIGNVTVTQTVAPSGYLTLYPQGSPPNPATSNVNWFAANQNLNASAIVALNQANGKLTIHNGIAGGSNPTHVIFDAAAFVF